MHLKNFQLYVEKVSMKQLVFVEKPVQKCMSRTPKFKLLSVGREDKFVSTMKTTLTSLSPA